MATSLNDSFFYWNKIRFSKMKAAYTVYSEIRFKMPEYNLTLNQLGIFEMLKYLYCYQSFVILYLDPPHLRVYSVSKNSSIGSFISFVKLSTSNTI